MDNNLTLLYVEDNPEILENVTCLFKEYVEKVLTAQDGQEALEKYSQHKPDIVVTDINMPKLNGLELAKRIRRENKYIPIIIMSAQYGLEELTAAIDIGVSSYIKKPFTLDKLKECTRKAIAENDFFQEKETLKENFTLVNRSVLILNTNKHFLITEVTDALVELSGYTREELLKHNPSTISSKETPRSVYKDLYATITVGYVWHGEIKNKTKTGDYYWVALSITPLFDKLSNIKGYTSIYTDITNTKQAEEKANKDALTSLYNRTMFDEMLYTAINTAKRHNIRFTYMMIDIDHFKEYNDEYGHQNGDIALQRVASVLAQHTQREQDHAFRVGGEEFILILLGLDAVKSLAFANKIREDVLNLNIEHTHNSSHEFLSISLGVYIADGDEIVNKEKIYSLADNALYVSKDSGRNKVTLA